MSKYAIISVTDKSNIIEFAKYLKKKEYNILTSGGTGKLLSEANINVIQVSDFTGMKEILGGRVKTLHPKIYAGILSTKSDDHQSQLKENNYVNIDLVVCNLYQFKKAVNNLENIDEIIEHIDIGGPTLIRAAAKNYHKVTVITDPDDYEIFYNTETISETFRLKMAAKAFTMIAMYDIEIVKYFNRISDKSTLQNSYFIAGTKFEDLRYGENSHQNASVYIDDEDIFYKHLHGNAVSYNNILDLNAGMNIIDEFDTPACAIIKHRTPCGVAIDDKLINAYNKALASDKLSAFGGVYCFNRVIDEETAIALSEMFVDTIIAPAYDKNALDILTRKEKITILKRKTLPIVKHDISNIPGGFVVQEKDSNKLSSNDITVVTDKEDNNAFDRANFAWKVVKHSKSNAIVICTDNATLGIASGETSRVDATRHAIERAGDNAKGAILASDAFFPFPDSVELAANAGISTIIVPKGSIRDQLSVDMANKHGITLIHTDFRAFKH